MKLVWEYFPNNICTDLPVAALKKDDGSDILYVYESKRDHYTLISKDFSFIKPFRCSYEKEKKLFEEQSKSSEAPPYIGVLEANLRIACDLIEADFKEQTDKILELLS